MVNPSAKVHIFKAYALPIVSVTVYSDRAEVKRTIKTTLMPGENEVIIENVPKCADTESVRVDGRGAAVINEVQFQTMPALPEQLNTPKIQSLKKKRKELLMEKQSIEDRRKVLQRRADVLDQIVSQVGGSIGKPSDESEEVSFILGDDTLANIKKFFSFHEENSLAVREKSHQCDEEMRIIDEKISKLNVEVGQAENEIRFSRNITALLMSTGEVEVELDVSYQVRCASWHPSYDVRVYSGTDEKNRLKLTYFGNIQQNTGEDWTDAPLVLSTAQPALGGDIPEMGTLNASFYKQPPPVQPQPRMRLMRKMAKRAPELNQGVGMFGTVNETEDELDFEPPLTAAPVTATESVLSTFFRILRPATIPSDSDEHRVIITTMEMEPVMMHEAVPKKDTNAYLIAAVLNESLFPLLVGQASIYLNNSYITMTNIKAVSPGERFICCLGVDPAVKIEYNPAHEFSEQIGILSKSASTVHEQKFVIKNTKKEKILITVRDHVPKSTDERIKIRLFLPELEGKTMNDADRLKAGKLPTVGARLDDSHNLEWTLALDPNTETELLIKWAVEHPNGETVEFREVF